MTNIVSVKLFADGADLKGIEEMCGNPLISGFTTNPTLMRKAGVVNYQEFAMAALSIVGNRPISFEVFSDEPEEMERQAIKIASWGENVYVKIPITNTKGVSMNPLIERLSAVGIKVNVTALLTLEQVEGVLSVLKYQTPAVISIFAGRIADTGRDPVPVMQQAIAMAKARKEVEMLWASPRELFNILQADQVGCHIITATNDILKKLTGLGKDLTQLSRETVQMFYDDAQKAGYTLGDSPLEVQDSPTV